MNYRDLDLNLLIVLNVLLEERNVTNSATRLGISQPATSVALSKLREFFNDELFIRTAAGLVPTSLAESLRSPVAEIIEKIEGQITNSRAFDPANARRRFVFAASDLGEIFFYPKIIQLLKSEAPHCSVTCVSLPVNDLGRAMERGEVDVALGYFPDLDINGMSELPLLSLDHVVIARADHPHIQGSMTIEQFETVPHAIVSHEARHQQEYEAQVAKNALRRNVFANIAHIVTAPAVIRDSDLISVVPDLLATEFAEPFNLQVVPLPFQVPRLQAKMYWHARSKGDASARWFRTALKRMFTEQGQ
ncbi:LysR family transcriptional regulator [Pseudomonas sp. BN411]|uniref:LysR family transcriptional regulator n=1 Tax=Pseudomonas sp. BN411 TaxID=2567887 RepID=UPI002459106F|nr:LysR family transcriptional regulator [Pseudomonas sp. BN411]MDH4560504.1 LysR family transcriptional regulator [Pseudomonas sp. BN411]